MSARRALEGIGVLLFVLVLAAWVRDVDGMRHRYAPDGAQDDRWFARDADGLYHTRRVARAIDEGLSVDGRDPYLNYPDGAAIPWPPYYDLALATALAPFAPEDRDERREFLEHAVGGAPFVFGVATSGLAAACAGMLGGVGAALIAGSYHALTRGAINYTVIGNGDHHGWVSLLTALLFAAWTRATIGGALRDPKRSAAWGAACGVLAAAMIGSWVASLLTVLLAQATLAWMIVRRVRTPLEGLASFGFAFHVAAALALLPAVLQSPWNAVDPWMIVNLSWFHEVELALGALVFVPLLVAGRGALAERTNAARTYPWIVALVLAALGATVWFANVGPAAAIREGWEWVARTNSFMDVVQESEPLLGARAEPGALTFALGYAVWLAPIAWIFIAWRAFVRRELALVLWAIALAPMALQALQQRRFAEALALPLSVALGLGAVALFLRARSGATALARGPAIAWLAVALLAVGAAQAKTLQKRWQSSDPAFNWAIGTPRDHYLGERKLLEWLHARAGGDASSVLAHWDKGHAIEWVADRPTVATNFGSYVGEASYRDPPRFFLGEDPDEAERLLERRKARHVLAHGYLPLSLPTLTRANDRARPEAFYAGGAPTERWLGTIGAMLLADGAPRDGRLNPSGNPLGFLRLVHVSPFVDARVLDPTTRAPIAAGTIWERVRGASVEAHGALGDELAVELDVAYPNRAQPLRFRARAKIGEDRVARVRVPYATLAANGEGVASGPLRWTLRGRTGLLDVAEKHVIEGATLRVP